MYMGNEFQLRILKLTSLKYLNIKFEKFDINVKFEILVILK